ncbi:hypothetical protein H6P81_018067 [Aristolochia fimbriata]|uniref:Reverse transcriptase domain-containing protein n=1 Tax=Aristolochia fimbriata TaxID=158543 RepID=A0AAV7E0R1_ARIFI|nr:hypothetical protein H6P81_018067 [Aristolochia fimbriata]
MKTRQILDAAMVAHEVADSFMRNREPRVIIKLDMEKAFDRVDWNFLDAMMQQMGFRNRWRTWMRSCVSSAAYSISVNGGTFGYFRGSRGLRQGDPLSPLLFNIVGEGLTALVKIARRLDWIQPVISEDFIPLTQFADDTILFGVGTEEEILRWKALIGLFELASGQKVNWHNVPDRLEKIFRDFLWKGGQEGFKYHLVRWEEVCKPKSLGGLGIRRLRIMSKALLGKWCWKINQNTDTPWCAIVRAKLGIDGDPWVQGWDSPRRLSESPLRVAFPRLYRLARMQEATVADIVGSSPPQMIDWAEVFIRELTEVETAEFGSFNTNIQTFYPCTNVEDELVWSLSPNGSYTVASAYTHFLGHPGGSSQAKLAWKLEAPPKVKMFIWSVAHNKILTRENLVRRGISLPSLLCPLCQDKQESVDHLLLQCTMAWHIWSWFMELFRNHWCIPSRVMDLLRQKPPPWLALRVNLCGALAWHSSLGHYGRREIGECSKENVVTGEGGDQIRSNWCAIATMKQGNLTDAPVGWRPPPSGCIKLNFDGSSQGNPSPAGFGGVFRDHEGTIFLTYAGPLGHEDSTVAEMTALLQGLRIFRSRLQGKLLVEGDSKNVIGWCEGGVTPPWRLCYSFREILDLAKERVEGWSYIPRAANAIADSLARNGVSLVTVTIRDTPPFL